MNHSARGRLRQLQRVFLLLKHTHTHTYKWECVYDLAGHVDGDLVVPFFPNELSPRQIQRCLPLFFFHFRVTAL